MNVLVACEESQVVCKAIRELGGAAYSCDLMPCSGGHPEWHIQGDVEPLLDGDCGFATMDGREHHVTGQWDMIIAHPPCTYLSNAGACRLYPHKGQMDMERYAKGMEGRKFFMRCLEAKCDHVAVENPIPSTVFNLPPHSQQIHPWEFDSHHEHPYTKATRLWLKGLPLLQPTTPDNHPVGPYVPSGTSRKNRATYGAAKRGEDAKNRAKTFIGIADAMAAQWYLPLVSKIIK